MNDIIVRAQNPLQLPESELASLIEAIRRLEGVRSVSYDSREQRGYSVTWWEVVHVVLPAAGVYLGVKIIDEIVSEFVSWARGRLKRDGEPRAQSPKYVAIYGPDGKIVKSVVVNPDASVVDKTLEDQKSEHH
jgi:hypothetical protein